MGINRTNIDQFQLRLPQGLRERIKEHAERNRRSLNSEIIVCLEKALGSTSEEPRNGDQIR
ncbi:Arc family DNA-binding protein [Rhizobium laguerreae]|uniref:Arc family DNA-binding protein n=1 Tax=Rhizobium laguerreae TaxID=1076926 RepID=UPI001C92557E|nr:Arc family DNA-binding protein [Rhizobium laguerreae]MBY3268642.1 Arc family DNA-binding protein [Rhizobium laguerreae]